MKKESVWLEFTPLSNHLKTINLGQGFPGWEPESFVKKSLLDTCHMTGISQYSSPQGEQILRKQIASSYKERQKGSICPDKEILVTVGASEGIYLAIKALVEPGEEVIILEPFFDLYEGAIDSCGANAKYVALEIPANAKSTAEIRLNLAAIEDAITEKTRLIIVNTPHNPTGKVFSKDELSKLGTLLEKYPEIKVLSDEVYEHLVYDKNQHVSPRSISALRDKTVCLYSAGKTFSITGWKIGWAIGAEDLIDKMTAMQQWVVFSVATPLQHAVANLLKTAKNPYKGHKDFYSYLRQSYYKKREHLQTALERSGFEIISPEGGFFICASATDERLLDPPERYLDLIKEANIKIDRESLDYPSYNLSRRLSLEKKVTSIPMAAFLSLDNKKTNTMVRFAFCKKDEELEKAGMQLERST